MFEEDDKNIINLGRKNLLFISFDFSQLVIR